ncbi:MAG TPA: hypothetical protein VKN14_07310, partial [Flavobacteriaceae bacterium]|nr:hypothetical protein [Flavobacteriaceae bacterium]
DSNEALPVIENQLEQGEIESDQVVVNIKKQALPDKKESKRLAKQHLVVPKENLVNTDEVIAEVKHKQNPVEEKINNISFEDQKIQEVVAQIQDLQRDDKDITEAEIDQLLQQAENQIKQKRLYGKSTKTVDASSLLQDVELELELSFRDKVLEALLSSYKSVKVAVINRNE